MLIGVRLRSGVLRVDGEAVPEGCRVEVMMDASFFQQVLELGQVVGSEVVGELVLNPEALDVALLLHARGGGDDDGVERDLLEVPGEGGVFDLFPVVGNGLLLRGWIAALDCRGWCRVRGRAPVSALACLAFLWDGIGRAPFPLPVLQHRVVLGRRLIRVWAVFRGLWPFGRPSRPPGVSGGRFGPSGGRNGRDCLVPEACSPDFARGDLKRRR